MPYTFRNRNISPIKDVNTTSKSVKSSKPINDDYKSIHNNVVNEIKTLGPKIKNLAKNKVNKSKIGKKYQKAHAVQSRIIKSIDKSIEKKTAINAAVIKRSINQEIKTLV